MSRFGKFTDRTLRDLAMEAVSAVLADVGIEPERVEAAYVGNGVAGTLSGQENIRGQVMLRHSGMLGIPIINVENACASASTAFHLACMAIASGQYELVLALGAEKMTHPDKRKVLTVFDSSVDLSELPQLEQRLGLDPSQRGTRSLFMDLYAAGETDARPPDAPRPTREQMALVSVKNHEHGSRNPFAQYRETVSVDEVLESRPIAGDLTLLMCAPIGDGAAATLVASREWMRREGRDGARVRASVLVSGRGDNSMMASSLQRASERAYTQASVDPRDLNLIEVHDATAPAELSAYEDLGLCQRGEAAVLIEQRQTWLGGRVPVNPSGGLLSRGHPIGATGIAQIAEAYWQLTGRCGDRQVEGARLALTQNAGGFLGSDVAAQCVHILERPASTR
jgi:acetyl-CoA acetyltransferase